MDFETLKTRYDNGRISKTMLKLYVKKGIITDAQYTEITGEVYAA